MFHLQILSLFTECIPENTVGGKYDRQFGWLIKSSMVDEGQTGRYKGRSRLLDGRNVTHIAQERARITHKRPYFNNDKSAQFDAPTDMAALEDLTVRYHREGSISWLLSYTDPSLPLSALQDASKDRPAKHASLSPFDTNSPLLTRASSGSLVTDYENPAAPLFYRRWHARRAPFACGLLNLSGAVSCYRLPIAGIFGHAWTEYGLV